MSIENNTLAAISPIAELALRKHVERAVRPVSATEERKLRMREELLAHLVGIFHLERNQLEESAAIDRARERFGVPADLTSDLNAALPFSERCHYFEERYERAIDRNFSRRPGEPLARYLVRSVAKVALLTFLLIFGVLACFSLIGGPPDDPSTWSVMLKLFPLIVLGECTALFAALAVEQLTARHLGPRRWFIIAAQAAGWSTLLILATAGFWWWISGRPFSPAEAARVGISILATVCFVLVAAAFACDYSRRRKAMYDAWRLLPIDE